MSYVEGFEGFALGSSVDLSSAFPLTPTVTRAIVAPGKDGGHALSLDWTGGDRTIRRGVDGPSMGRNPYFRIGFTAYLVAGSAGGGMYGNGRGRVLFDVRVAAERNVNPLASYVYDGGGAIMRYDMTTHLYDTPASYPDRGQVTGVLETYAYRQTILTVGVTSDGYLKVVQGDDFSSTFSRFPIALASMKPIQFSQWVQMEFEMYLGTYEGSDGYIRGYVENELAFEATGLNLAVNAGMYLFYGAGQGAYTVPYPTSDNGGQIFNADQRGFFDFGIPTSFSDGSMMDDLYVFTGMPVTPGVPFGDLVVIDLDITGDGPSPSSTIGGTAPEPTRWESVLTNDGDASFVETTSIGGADAYEHGTLDSTRTVVALRVMAEVRKSDSGTAGIELLEKHAHAGPHTEYSETTIIDSAVDYQHIEATFFTDPHGNPLTPARVDAADVGFIRTR